MNFFSYLSVEFVFVVHSDLIEGKRVSVEDVIKAVVGVKSGFSKCGNHDASPGSTRHQVSALTRHSYRDALHQLTTVVMYSCMCVCVCYHTVFCGFSCEAEVGHPSSHSAQTSSGHFSSLCPGPPPEQG